MLENLPADTLPRLLGRTTLSTLIVGGIALVIAVLLGQPLGAVGVACGVGLALLNLRVMFRQVEHVEANGERTTKEVRRQLGSRTMVRLGVLTAIVFGALTISKPFGVGIVAGLVLYQLVFVANMLRVVVIEGGIQ